MILEEWVPLIIYKRFKPYYESKGYILDIPLNDTNRADQYQALVHVDDISHGSHARVTRICDECGKIDFITVSKKRFKHCNLCGNIMSRNPQYRCVDCGKLLIKSIGRLVDPRCKTCNKNYIQTITNKNEELTNEKRLELFWEEFNEF